MIDKNQFIAAAKQIIKRERGMKSPQLIHPAREWYIGLCLALVVFFAAAAWSANTYLTYRNVSVESTGADETEVVSYRESLVASALQIFADKAAALGTLDPAPAVVELPPIVSTSTPTSTDAFISTSTITDRVETATSTDS